MHAHLYYDKFILQYLVSDAQYLLDAKEPRSGLLLAPVVSGIDAIGGALMGFRKGSAERSKKVMTDQMGIDADLAKFIYSSLRCGLVHQGTAKYGLRFFAEYGNLNRDSVAYEGENEWIYLDSVLLAQKFISAAENIWECHKDTILFAPEIENSGHDGVIKLKLPPIDDFLKELTEFQECTPPHVARKENGRWIRDFASRSYSPPVTELKNTLELPPNTK